MSNNRDNTNSDNRSTEVSISAVQSFAPILGWFGGEHYIHYIHI